MAKHRKGFFEEHLFMMLYEELTDELRPLCLFDYFTGMRKGEAIGILWDPENRGPQSAQGRSARECGDDDQRS